MSELKGEYIVKLTGDFEGVEMDSQDKEYLIKRISKAFFRMNNLKPNKKSNRKIQGNGNCKNIRG